MTIVLEARSVTQVFTRGVLRRSRTVAIDDVSLRLSAEHPSIIGIAGESGSGKTTLARLCLGMMAPTAGDVLYRDRPLRTLSRREWRAFRREVQAVFQDPFESFNPFYKVDHVLSVPLPIFGLAKSPGEARQLIGDALELVGLRAADTLGRYPHQLSGGQRQRLMVARALLLKPQVIVADEPVSMVDASLRATILDTILRLKDERGISVLYITHDLTTAFQVSDRMMILYSGSVAEAGDTESVIHDPKHPYTKLLIHSIPRPDPKKKWIRETRGPVGTAPLGGCRFADRCPVAMEMCHQSRPPLFQTSATRGVACFLYRDNPVTDTLTALGQASDGPSVPQPADVAVART